MTQDVAGNVTSFVLTGLEIYTTYSISIQGRTILLGEASTTVNATTDEDGMCCTKCMIYVYSHHTTITCIQLMFINTYISMHHTL